MRGLFLQVMVYAVVCLFVLASCMDDLEYDGFSSDTEIEFVCSKENRISRVAVDPDSGYGGFTDGDQVSVYLCPEDSRWDYYTLTNKGGAWSGIEKKDMGTYLTTLCAFYPSVQIQPGQFVVIDYSVAVNQESRECYENSDLLGTHKVIPMYSNPEKVELEFTHLMHRVDIHLLNLPSESDNVKVEVYAAVGGHYDLFMGTMKMDDESPKEWISANRIAEDKFSAIIPPQPLPYGSQWIRITLGDKVYNYNSPGQINGSKDLESGKACTVKLTFMQRPEEPVDAKFANTTHWVYGCKPIKYDSLNIKTYDIEPESFPKGEWFKIKFHDYEYLVWDENAGWYDCDKVNPYAESTGYSYFEDWNMCWAASASNLLHWWMFHNRDYIQKYDERFGVSPYPEYPRPSREFFGNREYDKQGMVVKTESEIFDFFRKTCRNIGNSSHFGVNWFVSGAWGIPLKDAENPFGGYFSEVFKDKYEVAKHSVRYPGKMMFNQIVKDAFRKDQALGMAVFYSGLGGTHDMVMWGAEFDDKGYVSAVYYVDNNDYYDKEVIGGTKDFQHHLCIRKEVVYDDEGVYLGTSKMTKFMALNTVDLGRDVWKSVLGE